MIEKPLHYKKHKPPLLMTKYGWATPSLLFVTFAPLLILESTPGVTPVELGVFAGFFLLMFIWFSKNAILHTSIHLSPLDFSIALLFIFFIFDLHKVLSADIGFATWLQRWRGFAFLLVYFPISREFRSKKRLNTMFFLVIAVGTLISVLRLRERLSLANDVSALYIITSVQSAYPWWSLLLLICMVRFVFSKQVKINNIVKVLFIFALSVCMLNSFSGAARTPLITTFFSIILSFFFNFREQKRIPAKSIVILVVILGSLYTSTELYSKYFLRLSSEAIEYSFQTRFARYREAWEVFTKYPIWGNIEEEPFVYRNIKTLRYEETSIHSLYFYFLAEGGLIGSLTLIFFIYSALSFSIRVLKLKLRPDLRMYVEASFIILLSMCVAGITSTVMMQVESWLFLGILLGALNDIYAMGRNLQNVSDTLNFSV